MSVSPPKPLVRAETPLGIRVKLVGRKGNAFIGRLVEWTQHGVTVDDGVTKATLPAHRVLAVFEVKP